MGGATMMQTTCKKYWDRSNTISRKDWKVEPAAAAGECYGTAVETFMQEPA